MTESRLQPEWSCVERGLLNIFRCYAPGPGGRGVRRLTESGFSRVELRWFAKHKTEPPVAEGPGGVGFWTVFGLLLGVIFGLFSGHFRVLFSGHFGGHFGGHLVLIFSENINIT